FHEDVVHGPLPEAFVEQAMAESLKLPARVWQAALEGLLAADDSDRLGQIAAPTLLIWGERDYFITPEEQERLAVAIPDARLVIYPATGHAPHWERPERIVGDLEAFVKATATSCLGCQP
ncbi:MAG: alpha/beta hydrolase, partial [Chloroflexota bacterium]|nr:alpha/beta hydrolase [Chloroflexota bacterium]